MKSSMKYITSGIFVVILMIFVSNVYAITGSIGNARMVLRPELGDKIEKSILVRNINDVPVDIELSVFGDLEKYITIKDNNFTLQPEEDRKAFFIIDVQKGGVTETKINVKFTPTDGKNGVGLSSTIIVIVKEKEGNWDLLNLFDNKEENETLSIGQKNNNNKEKSKLLILSSISTFVLFIVLLILVFLASKHIKKRRENKSKKSFHV